MDNTTISAHVVRGVFKLLRIFRVRAALAMKPEDRSASAHGLSYALLASLWQRRNQVPAWREIYDEWERQLPRAGDIDPALYGAFHSEDCLQLLTDNRAAFSAREALFATARETIDVATYYLQGDETGWNTARQLASSAARGVRVRVVADRAATARKIFENPEVARVGQFLRENQVDYRLFSDPARPYDATHRKLLIVDRQTLITGGRNYADHYSGGHWRDVEVHLTGPSVAALQPVFEETFQGACPRQSVVGLFQTTSPEAIRNNATFLYLLQCIRASRNTLDIENAYYIHHPILQRHLSAACARGVRVRVFTNSEETNDLDFTNYRIYYGFPELLKAGVELYLRTGKGRTLHCKYFVADGEWVGFGSSNLDFYSPRFCRESGIHARCPELGRSLTDWFEQGISEAELLTDPEPAKAVLRNQPIGRLFDTYFTDIQ